LAIKDACFVGKLRAFSSLSEGLDIQDKNPHIFVLPLLIPKDQGLQKRALFEHLQRSKKVPFFLTKSVFVSIIRYRYLARRRYMLDQSEIAQLEHIHPLALHKHLARHFHKHAHTYIHMAQHVHHAFTHCGELLLVLMV